MEEEKTTKRRKLKVIEVKPTKQIGKGTLIPFTAEDIDARGTFDYECWSKILAEHLVVGKLLDVDIEYSQKGQYKHRRMIELYVGGKPLPKESAKSFSRGKSKEELAQIKQLAEAQNRSIQDQTALKAAVELAVGGKIENEQILSYAEVFRRFLRSDLTIKDEAVFVALIAKHFKLD